ncbi:MAG: endo-1,4-beta-xylanase, partial [Treponemataceae bacterium]|nr:endo-1,4-beta-xylanase [Treponemataceae bacterium]
MAVRLTDEKGQPVCLTDAEYSLRTHEFLFGCTANAFVDYFGHPSEEVRKNSAAKMEKWLKLFNYATVQVYWGIFEPKEGQTMHNLIMQVSRYLKDHNITLKGHPLCWHTVCADWLMQYDNKTILEKQLARIRREVGNFAGIIDAWDVINETVIMDKFDRYDNAVTRICREYGKYDLIKMVFDEAHNTNGKANLLLNDFNMSNAYVDVLKRCLDMGVPITTIGLQSHQHQGYWGIEKIEEVLSRFEPLGLPIHFTENTLVSGPLIPPEIEDLNDWHYERTDWGAEYEERQKREMMEMYSHIFEHHPQVTGFTTWDFQDGMWLNAPSGLIRTDGSCKPSYEGLDELINHRWHTEGAGRTSESGILELSGIKGVYTITTRDGRKAEVTLSDAAAQSGEPVTV